MNIDEMKIDEFIDLLGSNAPAPGGGAAAALIGSIGIALSEMVCSLTVTSKKYADVSDKASEYKEKCNKLAKELLSGMQKDATAYSEVSSAYKMPHETDAEKAARSAKIQKALEICVIPPMDCMKLAYEALNLTGELLDWTTKSASSDIGVAASSLGSVLKSAWLNVLINVNAIKDINIAEKYRTEGKKLLDDGLILSEKIYKHIEENL